MCADLTDEQNSHSVQQRQLTHHYEHLEQFSFSAKIKHNTFETFSYKKNNLNKRMQEQEHIHLPRHIRSGSGV